MLHGNNPRLMVGDPLKRLFFTLVVGIIIGIMTLPHPADAETPPVPCINKLTGRIVVRDRCVLGTETQFRKSSYATPDTALRNTLTTVTDTTTTNTSNIASNNAVITSLSASVASHTAPISSNTSDVAALLASANTLTTTVSSQAPTLASHTTTLNALIPAKRYTVASSGAQYTTVESAVSAAITDGVGLSAPGVIVVSPGVYTISSTLYLTVGLTIQGSGIDRTIIEGTDSGVTLFMPSSSALENLTLRKTTASVASFASITSATNVALRNVKFDLSSSSGSIALYMNNASVSLDTVQFTHTLTGNSNLNGTIAALSSTVNARKLVVSVTCLDSCKGFYIDGTTVFNLSDSDIQVNESTFSALGIQLAGTAAMKITNTRIAANSIGAYGAVGMEISSSSTVTILRSDISCTGASSAHACITNIASPTTQIGDSRITVESGLNTVTCAGSGAAKVVNTSLLGGSTSGAVSCAGVTDQNLAYYLSTCP